MSQPTVILRARSAHESTNCHSEGTKCPWESNRYYHVMPGNQYYIYILTTTGNTALYTGITNNLIRRIYEHKNNIVKGFTMRYNVHKLVYYEVGDNILAAIEREKQIKSWVRKKSSAAKCLQPGLARPLYRDSRSWMMACSRFYLFQRVIVDSRVVPTSSGILRTTVNF